MIPLYDLLKIKFPSIDLSWTGPVVLQDHNDGQGVVIGEWNVPNVAQPSASDLAAWQNDPVVISAYNHLKNAEMNSPIVAQLELIDAKSIRSLRENDAAMLAQLTAEAVALRAQLLPTS